MKKLGYPMLVGLLLSISACNLPASPVEQPTNPPETPVTEDTPTLAPYEDDTPSPPKLDAPIVEVPSLDTIHFINSLDGWGVTEKQIVRTNDGGITWYDITPPDIKETSYGVELIVLDNTNVWTQMMDFENYPNSGFIYRTSDGGFTWTSMGTPFSNGDIHFLDASNGWVLADLGVGAGSNAVAVYQTTDGGNTWTQKYINDPNAANAGDSLPLGGLKAGIAPLDMQTAWVYGVIYETGTPYLFRTDDGGSTWNEVTLPLPVGVENYELGIDRDQMKFLSPRNGFIAMRLTGDIHQLAVYVTQDGGNTWTLTATPIPDGGSADFLSEESMVIYNGKQFYITQDAARNWNIISPDVNFSDIFAGMDFVNSTTGWVITLDADNHRSFFRTGDGGKTWFPVVP